MTGVPHGKKWTSLEVITLRALYPDLSLSRAEIEARFEGRKWSGIERKAAYLGIRRGRPQPDTTRATPIIRALREERLRKKLPCRTLAMDLPFGSRKLTQLELGFCQPRIGDLIAWADALGLELRAVRRYDESVLACSGCAAAEAAATAAAEKAATAKHSAPEPSKANGRGFSITGPSIVSSLRRNPAWRRTDNM